MHGGRRRQTAFTRVTAAMGVAIAVALLAAGCSYQSWMLAETRDLRNAVADQTSSEHL